MNRRRVLLVAALSLVLTVAPSLAPASAGTSAPHGSVQPAGPILCCTPR